MSCTATSRTRVELTPPPSDVVQRHPGLHGHHACRPYTGPDDTKTRHPRRPRGVGGWGQKAVFQGSPYDVEWEWDPVRRRNIVTTFRAAIPTCRSLSRSVVGTTCAGSTWSMNPLPRADSVKFPDEDDAFPARQQSQSLLPALSDSSQLPSTASVCVGSATSSVTWPHPRAMRETCSRAARQDGCDRHFSAVSASSTTERL